MSETERFKAKYGAHEAPRQSAFLRKRLQGGNKYFDSGDYNVAKSNKRKDPTMVIGKAIPTVDKLPQRKPSSSKLSNLLEGDNPPEKTNSSTEEEVKDEKSELPDEKNAKLDLADGK